MREHENVPVVCPACGMSVISEARPCGCVEYRCGTVATCKDYYHGDGVVLTECLEETNAAS